VRPWTIPSDQLASGLARPTIPANKRPHEPGSGWTLAFDLDGTLVETAPDLIGALNAVLVEQGLPPVPMASARHLVGSGVRVMLEHGFAEAGADLRCRRTQAPLMDRFIDIYLGRIAQESRPYPGVVETLEAFARDGARLVVVTNKRTDLSLALMQALDLTRHFGAIVGPDLVSAKQAVRRPSQGSRRGRRRRARHVAVMTGDSYPDLAAARALGAPVILTSFGYTDPPARDLGADAVDR
jgi:phosphoglycolate phosphatase